MDMTINCERITVDDRESFKDDKESAKNTSCGNNNIAKEDTVSALGTSLEERLNLKPTVNGSINGVDDDSDHSISNKTQISSEESKVSAQEPCSINNEESTCSKIDSESSEEIQIKYVAYESELQMPDIMRLIQKDLSEPYSIYTYRYFIHNWPKLCFLAMHNDLCVGAIVCKLDFHRKMTKRGYIAMLAVDEKYRKQKIGSKLVRLAIQGMVNDKADEVVLETEITNQPALRLYENLGFVRDKRLFRYYLNGVDALRLKLWLR